MTAIIVPFGMYNMVRIEESVLSTVIFLFALNLVYVD